MKPSLFTRLFAALLVAFSVACTPPSPTTSTTTAPEKAAPSASAAAPATANVPPVPTAFPDPPDQQKWREFTTANGKQIYTCGPKKDDATQFVWTLKAPQADLLDSKGYKIGTHYAVPSGSSWNPAWESNDGSKVIGDRGAAQSKPAPGTIPWLLVPALPAVGKAKTDFGEVKNIQRLNTEGGTAPATGCDKANAGKEMSVDYKATYYFYVDTKPQESKAKEAKAK